MKKKIRLLINEFLLFSTGRGYYLTRIIVENWIKRTFYNTKINNKFLFILSPNYCGSTLLTQLIFTSSNVSLNNRIGGTREGQKLPEVISIMNIKNQFDDNIDFDWEFIKKQWVKYWDVTLPVLLEKSPPNLVRAKSISNFFEPSYFIIFYRNPYSHCQSLIKRDKTHPKEAAKFAVKCLFHQKDNIENLENVFILSYEELTDFTSESVEKLASFLPELSDINHKQKFSAHNFKNKRMEISNLNLEKINNLTNEELIEINEVFEHNKKLLEYFNYSIIKTI